MKKRNFILIVALSLSLMFAAGCGENKSTGADNSADRQERMRHRQMTQNLLEIHSGQKQQTLPMGQKQNRKHRVIIR